MLASDEGDTSISDADREAAIKRAAAAMEKHYAEWLVSGCFAAKGDADRAMRLMYLLIQGRSAGQVAAMEAERGLGPVAVAVEVQERTE